MLVGQTRQRIPTVRTAISRSRVPSLLTTCGTRRTLRRFCGELAKDKKVRASRPAASVSVLLSRRRTLAQRDVAREGGQPQRSAAAADRAIGGGRAAPSAAHDVECEIGN